MQLLPRNRGTIQHLYRTSLLNVT